MNTSRDTSEKTLIQKGFELGKGFDRAFVIGGLGVLAVGAAVGAPAVAAFGAVVAGGSIAGIEMTKRIERGYENARAKRTLGKTAIKAA